MLFALGAASSAIDALQSLTSSKASSAQTTGFSQGSTDPFDVSGGSTTTSGAQAPVTGGNGFTQISPATMSALLAAQGQSSATAASTSASTSSTSTSSASTALQDLFSQIDGNGDGQISKSEFESALGAGGTNLAQADKVFGELDKNGDGSVSLDEMKSALQGAGSKGGHHHHHQVADSDGSTGASGSSSGSGGSSGDALLQALAGASSNSVTNSDGSTTISITNADGSQITMTTPAAATTSASGTTSSSSATAAYNFLEQMIQRASQAISSGAAPSLSFSV
jgi:hypothetical protein